MGACCSSVIGGVLELVVTAAEFSRAMLAPCSVDTGCPCTIVEDVFEDFERPDDVGFEGERCTRQNNFEIVAMGALRRKFWSNSLHFIICSVS